MGHDKAYIYFNQEFKDTKRNWHSNINIHRWVICGSYSGFLFPLEISEGN